jgi:hypothetical protein
LGLTEQPACAKYWSERDFRRRKNFFQIVCFCVDDKKTERRILCSSGQVRRFGEELARCSFRHARDNATAKWLFEKLTVDTT